MNLEVGSLIPKVFSARKCHEDQKLSDAYLLMEDVSIKGTHFDFTSGEGLSPTQVIELQMPFFYEITDMELSVHKLSGNYKKL